jgi:glycine cleavage system H protein
MDPGDDAACLRVPADLYVLVEHQAWARPEADGRVTVGLTALGAHLAGDLYMCRPKALGNVVARGRSIAVAELAKTIVSFKTPVGGVVEAVNARLEDDPGLVGRDPYGDGWLARLRPDALDDDLATLEHGAAVVPAMAAYARLFRVPG